MTGVQHWTRNPNQPQNLYCDGEFIGVMASQEAAAAVADAQQEISRLQLLVNQLCGDPTMTTPDGPFDIAWTVHNALTTAGLADTAVLLTICTRQRPSASILKRGGAFTAAEADRLIAGFGDPEAWTSHQHNHTRTGEPIATTSTTTPGGLEITVHHEPRTPELPA